jgi:hypothetical protein
MRLHRISALALATLLSTACFHAIVETGRPAGTTVINKPWVSTFIFGLVPAADINVAATCPNGVARVETQQSFLNALVGIITLYIYTPETATITCASGGMSAIERDGGKVISAGASMEQRTEAVNAAVMEAARTGRPVFVRF